MDKRKGSTCAKQGKSKRTIWTSGEFPEKGKTNDNRQRQKWKVGNTSCKESE